MKRFVLLAVLLLPFQLVAQADVSANGSRNPKVRAVTAFVRLDRSRWEQQVAETLAVLRKTEAAFKSAGYEVESLRITTQPVGELVAGLSEDDGVAFLARFDQVVGEREFHSQRGTGHDARR